MAITINKKAVESEIAKKALERVLKGKMFLEVQNGDEDFTPEELGNIIDCEKSRTEPDTINSYDAYTFETTYGFSKDDFFFLLKEYEKISEPRTKTIAQSFQLSIEQWGMSQTTKAKLRLATTLELFSITAVIWPKVDGNRLSFPDFLPRLDRSCAVQTQPAHSLFCHYHKMKHTLALPVWFQEMLPQISYTTPGHELQTNVIAELKKLDEAAQNNLKTFSDEEIRFFSETVFTIETNLRATLPTLSARVQKLDQESLKEAQTLIQKTPNQDLLRFAFESKDTPPPAWWQQLLKLRSPFGESDRDINGMVIGELRERDSKNQWPLVDVSFCANFVKTLYPSGNVPPTFWDQYETYMPNLIAQIRLTMTR